LNLSIERTRHEFGELAVVRQFGTIRLPVREGLDQIHIARLFGVPEWANVAGRCSRCQEKWVVPVNLNPEITDAEFEQLKPYLIKHAGPAFDRRSWCYVDPDFRRVIRQVEGWKRVRDRRRWMEHRLGKPLEWLRTDWREP